MREPHSRRCSRRTAPRGKLLRETVEHPQVLLRGRQFMHRDGKHVVGHILEDVLIEEVADPRAVGQQLLDGDSVIDQREILTQTRISPWCPS